MVEQKKIINKSDRRWAWLEIDLAAIRHNVKVAKDFIGSNCKLLAVVKADAYGHGAVEVSKTALNAGASYLGVATVDEGVELRKANISAPILIFSQPPITSIPVLLKFDLMPSVYTAEFAVMYAEEADKQGQQASYHLALNTGMNRVGVRYNKVLDFLKLISFHRALKLEGTFTHFATADCVDLMDFKKQYANFCEAIKNMEDVGYNPGIVHCANSATIFRFPEAHFDMVRYGISMYGSYPYKEIKDVVELKQAMSVHAKIIDERILGLGEGVSYGFNYRARSAAKICTVPVGYADGLRRSFSQKIYVIYKGHKFPQVGNICMDQCMFEIDMNSAYAQENFDAHIGDEVVLLGKSGDEFISIEELAKIDNTITYEVMCGFSRRMHREFKK